MLRKKYQIFNFVLALLILSVSGILTESVKAETFLQDGDGYLAFAEKMPEIEGGLSNLYKNVNYPVGAIASGVEGKVFIIAYIDETGNVTDVKVLRGIGSGCDEAAVAAVKSCSFKPGEHEGKPVKVKMSLAIQFKL